jgi:hypothetical protein
MSDMLDDDFIRQLKKFIKPVRDFKGIYLESSKARFFRTGQRSGKTALMKQYEKFLTRPSQETALMTVPHSNEYLESLQKHNPVKEVRTTTFEIGQMIINIIDLLKNKKPNDRSELDRNYAVIITDAEKLFAYFRTYIQDKTAIEDNQDG